ncbi:unnamed protein product [Durusdinium trenchii]|uniref:Uncharacterized protein n=1 Tax=Durusdinium trenchii TaxID=1381693 RepID=A0ABP0T2B5_9DINO
MSPTGPMCCCATLHWPCVLGLMMLRISIEMVFTGIAMGQFRQFWLVRPCRCFSIADDEHPQCKPIRSPQFQAIEEDPKPRDVLEENEALRLALGECWQRLQELEAERADFNSEGVFDLVNSLCHGVKAGRFRHVAGEGPELSSCEHEP